MPQLQKAAKFKINIENYFSTYLGFKPRSLKWVSLGWFGYLVVWKRAIRLRLCRPQAIKASLRRLVISISYVRLIEPASHISCMYVYKQDQRRKQHTYNAAANFFFLNKFAFLRPAYPLGAKSLRQRWPDLRTQCLGVLFLETYNEGAGPFPHRNRSAERMYLMK
jgi:hypothetical protein